MIRLQLSPDPQWLDLGHGVRLQLLPLTTALMVATRSDPAVQDIDPEASNDARAAIFAGALARRAVVDWEGVGDENGAVVAVSPGMLLDAEKNVSAPLPNGTSAGATATARPAEANAKTAPPD